MIWVLSLTIWTRPSLARSLSDGSARVESFHTPFLLLPSVIRCWKGCSSDTGLLAHVEAALFSFACSLLGGNRTQDLSGLGFEESVFFRIGIRLDQTVTNLWRRLGCLACGRRIFLRTPKVEAREEPIEHDQASRTQDKATESVTGWPMPATSSTVWQERFSGCSG